MKKNYISLIFRIIGIILIITGIIMTVIPMFSFDVFTFNLGRSMIFAFGFTFVGIVLIIISVMLNTSLFNGKTKELEDEISELIKTEINEEKESKKPTICNYCGGKVNTNSTHCENCGAKVKNNSKKN